MSEAIEGLFLLDKPAGVTSYDCVHLVKRQLQAQRVGHCGTLDPSARGLLIMLMGKATRQQERFHDLEKEYAFRAKLGIKTDTGDRDGQITQTFDFQHVTENRLEEVLPRFTGAIQQTPPRYSALKYKGKPYHLYARKGIEIPRIPRTVHIHQFDLTHFELPFWEGRVICSRGTYIRTLVEDVAEALGSGASLVELSRERVGSYLRSQAVSWEALRQSPIESLRARIQAVDLLAGVALV